jgi:thiol-disulfide isomerase/thioredoxin
MVRLFDATRLGLGFVLALPIWLAISESFTPAGETSKPKPLVVRSLALNDAHGQPVKRDEVLKSKVTVLLFLSTDCPVANAYTPLLARLAENYGSRGVAFYGVHCDPDATPQAALDHAREYGLPFPLLLDPTQTLPPQTGVRVTPEAVVLNGKGEVVYHGRIDNRYTERGKRRAEVTVHDLEASLEASLVGAALPTSTAEAFGCPLPPPRKGP